jgi:hypothetical protein
MRTFESSKISTYPTVETDKLSAVRFTSLENPISPPGFGELGLHTNNKTFSTIRRRERVSENLSMTHSYLKKQLDGLSEIQNSLILWIKSKADREFHCREEMIFMQPIENILSHKYHNIPLYGDGTEDPLKFHYLKDGSRDFLEILIVPLLTQPSMASLRIAFVQNLFVSTGLLESCGGEVMNQRMNVDSKLSQINDLSTSLIQVPECRVPTQLGRSSSSNFLLNFVRKAFGGIDVKQRLRAKEPDLSTSGSFLVNPKHEQL